MKLLLVGILAVTCFSAFANPVCWFNDGEVHQSHLEVNTPVEAGPSFGTVKLIKEIRNKKWEFKIVSTKNNAQGEKITTRYDIIGGNLKVETYSTSNGMETDLLAQMICKSK